MGRPISCLIYHSESSIAHQIISEFKSQNYTPFYQAFSDFDSGKEEFFSEDWDILFCEKEILGKTALQFIKELNIRSTALVVLVEKDDPEFIKEAFLAGVQDVLSTDSFFKIPLVAERERREKMFRKDREITANFLEHSLLELQYQKFAIDQASSVSITDAQGIITYVNHSFLELTGFELDDLIGKSHRVIKSEKSRISFWKEVWDMISLGKVWKGETENRRKDGTPYWADTTIVPFFGKDGSIYQYIAIHFDITSRKLAEKQLTHDAFYDNLTELPNRALFLARIEQRISHYLKNNDGFPVVLSINIDNFKRINNSLGHAFGDRVLQTYAERLVQIFSNNGIVSHFNADHFAVLTWDFFSEEEAFLAATKALDRLRELMFFDGIEVFLTASCGIASFGMAGREGEEILRNAEIAMFHAKSDSVGTASRYNDEMREKNKHLLEVQNDLKKAIEKNEFLVFYQPLIDLNSNEVAHWEALIRWKHPRKGMISPLDFIPLAEASGLIVPITRFVLGEAALFIKEAETQTKAKTSVAVNISSEVFYHQSVLNWIVEISKMNQISLDSLQIEITESLAMKSMDETVPLLQQLKDLGVKISLDDFGTGFSSLAYLEALPLNILKIDKSFLHEVNSDLRKKKLLSTVVQMAHDLNLEVVTEGVEEKEQLELLRSIDCDLVQGYFLSKPLPKDAAIVFLKETMAKKSKS